MLNVILLAWVLGIATMGKSNPTLLTLLPIFLLVSVTLWILARFPFYFVTTVFFKIVQGSCFAATAFIFGGQYANQALTERLQVRETQRQPVEVVVYVKSLNQLTENGLQQKVEVLGRHAQTVDWLLYLKQSQQKKSGSGLQLGQYYRISGQLKPAHSYATPGAFDQEKWWLQQDIMAAVRVETVQPISQAQVSRLGFTSHVQQQQGWWAQLRLGIEKMRLSCREFLQRQPVQHKGLLLGLLTGDQSLLYEATQAQFQRLGISHLLAISGPHVLIFAALVSWGLQQGIAALSGFESGCAGLGSSWQPAQFILCFFANLATEAGDRFSWF